MRLTNEQIKEIKDEIAKDTLYPSVSWQTVRVWLHELVTSEQEWKDDYAPLLKEVNLYRSQRSKSRTTDLIGLLNEATKHLNTMIYLIDQEVIVEKEPTHSAPLVVREIRRFLNSRQLGGGGSLGE